MSEQSGTVINSELDWTVNAFQICIDLLSENLQDSTEELLEYLQSVATEISAYRKQLGALDDIFSHIFSRHYHNILLHFIENLYKQQSVSLPSLHSILAT